MILYHIKYNQMSGLIDFISNSFPSEIVSSETIELVPCGIISHGRLLRVNIPRQGQENCKTIYSEPVLCLRLEKNSDQILNLHEIVNLIQFEIGGIVIDKLYNHQININQHRYNILPKQYGDVVLFPLPFNCLLKNNGIPFSTIEYYEHSITFETSSLNASKNIIDGCLYMNYTFVNKDIDLMNLTELNYSEMSKTKFHKNSLLKINNKVPSDFVSYYFINELNRSNKNNTNIPNVLEQNNQIIDNVSIVNLPKPHVFDIPVTLLKIKQTQFTGLENLADVKNAKYRLNFVHDVQSLYLQLNFIDAENSSTICNKKWFDLLRIQINGYDKLEYTYEMLCLHNASNSYKLPDGVLEIPNAKYLDWSADHISLCLSNIDTSSKQEGETMNVSFSVESDNYLVCGSQSKLMFQN
jgi:hypothetical protein